MRGPGTTADPQDDPTPSQNPQPGRCKNFLVALLITGVSGVAALVVAEIFLRIVPVPGISYHSYYYNPVTGGRYHPNTTNIYRSARGDYVRRNINSWGFMDYERALAKGPGVLRIGFFGDSYTEAQQVRIEDSFVQVIERRLNAGAGESAGARARVGESAGAGESATRSGATATGDGARSGDDDTSATGDSARSDGDDTSATGDSARSRDDDTSAAGDGARPGDDDTSAAGGGPRVECMSFGISGYSTLQSYLECRTWMDKFDLDWVVYVFVENDPGDQVRELKRSPGIPYAVARGDSFDIDFSFRDRFGYKAKRLHRMFQYVKSHSLVISTIVGRLKLLGKEGVKVRLAPEDMNMADTGTRTGMPAPTTTPSAWPDTLLAQTAALGARVLSTWAGEVKAAGRSFAVIYMPRQSELGKPYEEQDSWASWLAGVCEQNGVYLIDPSPRLLEAMSRREEVFYDHLTENGHKAVGDAFVDYFTQP